MINNQQPNTHISFSRSACHPEKSRLTLSWETSLLFHFGQNACFSYFGEWLRISLCFCWQVLKRLEIGWDIRKMGRVCFLWSRLLRMLTGLLTSVLMKAYSVSKQVFVHVWWKKGRLKPKLKANTESAQSGKCVVISNDPKHDSLWNKCPLYFNSFQIFDYYI